VFVSGQLLGNARTPCVPRLQCSAQLDTSHH
jgi:hypothetical protein